MFHCLYSDIFDFDCIHFAVSQRFFYDRCWRTAGLGRRVAHFKIGFRAIKRKLPVQACLKYRDMTRRGLMAISHQPHNNFMWRSSGDLRWVEKHQKVLHPNSQAIPGGSLLGYITCLNAWIVTSHEVVPIVSGNCSIGCHARFTWMTCGKMKLMKMILGQISRGDGFWPSLEHNWNSAS